MEAHFYRVVINLESLLLHGNEDFREQILNREEKRRKMGNKSKAHMARKGNPISVRLDLNRSSDSSRFSEGDRESHRMGQSFPSVFPIFIKKAWEDVADVRDGHDFF